MLRKLVKAFHEIGACGYLGALAVCIVLAATASDATLADYGAVRRGIALITQWILVPSLLLVVVSGLLAIAVHRPFIDARWAWMKALLGIVVFEGTLVNIDGTAQQLASIAAAAVETAAAAAVDTGTASGTDTPSNERAVVAALLRTEWLGSWTMVALSLVNVLLAVWRPRLQRAPSPRTLPPADS